MSRFSTAFRAFFGSLFNQETAKRVESVLYTEARRLNEESVEPPFLTPIQTVESTKSKPIQSEAITLLGTLQRESRLIDFLKEDLSAYSDDQIGTAVREIHRDAGNVLDRLFAIQPILSEPEGATVEIPAGFDAARYHLTGKLSGSAPYGGILRHHGWQITRSELPSFTGSESAATTIAPAEVEVSSSTMH